jgi:iron(III) transport system substrate-binding protein
LLSGCGRSPSRQIVLYTSVDEPIASPIIQDFENQTGIRVLLVTDTEATKSVGLAERLRAEKNNPQADVWWGNEPFYTIGLADDGMLLPYDSPQAARIDKLFKDPQHRWTGNGLRVRVIAALAHSGPSDLPTSIAELADPYGKHKFTIAMAIPTAGTTGGQVAALYAVWGNDRADQYFRGLRDNGIKLLGGNSNVAEAVARGTIDFGLTDNDDVNEAQEFVSPGGVLFGIEPDQGPTDIGTLMIPTTVGLVNRPHPSDDAKKLVDHLLSESVEKKLIDVKFAKYSASGAFPILPMRIDYDAVARMMPQAVRRATAIMQGRNETR